MTGMAMGAASGPDEDADALRMAHPASAWVAMSASVLRVEALRPGGGYAMGSAVAVAPGLVVTNCHVSQGAAKVLVVRRGARWLAQTVAQDAEHDLCVLRAPDMEADTLPLAVRAPAVGELVHALGYTGGTQLWHAAGRVTALHALDQGQVIQSSNDYSSGASGGALLNAQGELVGVLTFRLRGPRPAAFSAPVDWLRPLLAAQAPPRPAAPATSAQALATPAAYWQRPPEQQPRFLRLQSMLLDRSRWAELQRQALAWAQEEPDNPVPRELLAFMARQPEGLPHRP